MSIIKSLSVGDGDMFYIRHNSDNFSIIDCCMSEDSKEDIVNELILQGGDKGIRRFISTHPDDDHIRGLQYLHERWEIFNFYCVENTATKEEKTADFQEYCYLRDHPRKSFYLEKDCSRRWMNRSSADRGQAGINILWPVTDNSDYQDALRKAEDGDSPNNISPIIKYSLSNDVEEPKVLNGVTVLWMGDLETEFMEKIEDDISLEKIDILFAPHHGRDSGKVPQSWLDALDPEIIIIGKAPSTSLNYYQGYNTIKQNSAGDILFDCVEGAVHIYVKSETYKEKFLDNESKPDAHDLSYLGTLNLN